MTFEPGTRVGDYEVLGLLGAGGMGAVYRARNVVSDRVDAMKVIAGVTASPDLAERFLREIKLQARLRHPNIASLYTAFHFQDQLIMVMEYVEGATVDVPLARGPIEVASALSWIVQVLSALEYAHGLGVVHRDIKPTNIALTREGTAKLLDFGIAREIDDRGLTATGSAIGSVHYMSPEQLGGLPLDGRSDIYSVGLTLYEMVTGRRAVSGENGWAVMQAQMLTDPVAPVEVNPSVTRPLSAAILRAIAKRPEDRFQTAAEFAAALRGQAAEAGSGPILTGAPAAQPAWPGGALAGTAAGPARPPLASASAPTLTTDAAARLERILADFVGPIAGHLVRQVGAECADVRELCRRLGAEIPAEAERRAFLRACARELGPASLSDTARQAIATTVVPAPPTAPTWDPAVLERAKLELAAYIGPLARVIVERAAGRARDLAEFYALLAAEIASAGDRQAFLARRPKGAGP